MYCFHDKIRIYFMSFIVQISPFVHQFTLKIVFPLNPQQGSALDLLGASQIPRRKLCLHFLLYLATPLYSVVGFRSTYTTVVKELRSKMFGQHPGYFKAVFLKQTRIIIVSIYKYTVYIMF